MVLVPPSSGRILPEQVDKFEKDLDGYLHFVHSPPAELLPARPVTPKMHTLEHMPAQLRDLQVGYGTSGGQCIESMLPVAARRTRARASMKEPMMRMRTVVRDINARSQHTVKSNHAKARKQQKKRQKQVKRPRTDGHGR